MKISFLRLSVLVVTILFHPITWTKCRRTSQLSAADNSSAIIPAGKLNLPNPIFLPNGSLIKSVVVPPTNYTHRGSVASTILWICNKTDLSSMYFLVATNGDDRVGGFWQIGHKDGLSDVYATDLQYVGMKVMFGDVIVTRYYKKVPLTTYEISGDKINIRLADLPTAVVELYRVSELPPANGAASNYCANRMVAPSLKGTIQQCNQPNFYIELVGNGIGHDYDNEDSAHNFRFWGANNGFGYSMKQAASLYNVQTCAATSATPYVMFAPITSAELNKGKTLSQPFNVSLRCYFTASSGTGNGQTALGFQVSAGAYNAANALGLVNSDGGVSTLLSDNYGSSDAAKGVGFNIAYAATPTVPMWLLGGQSFIDPFNPNYTGSMAGWYPVLDHATQTGSQSSINTYVTNFIATLKKLDGQTVSAGKVHSTVTVQVRIQ